MRKSFWTFILTLLTAIIWLIYQGTFYQTGRQWYHSCWQKYNATTEWFAEPQPKSPEEAANWAQCTKLADEVTYGNGMVFTSNPVDENDKVGIALAKACPAPWSDYPINGIYVIFVKNIENSGGVSLVDNLRPAQSMLRDIDPTGSSLVFTVRIVVSHLI